MKKAAANLYRSVLLRYIFALSFLGGLTIFAYLALFQLISAGYHYGELINLSGKQRMLSQRIALLSDHMLHNPSEEARRNFRQAVETMEKDHRYLVDRPLSPELEAYYYGDDRLHQRVAAYLEEAREFSFRPDGESAARLFATSQELLPILDRVVSRYQLEDESYTEKIRWLETAIVVTALLVLLLEAIFIFKPSLDEIRRSSEKDLVIVENAKHAALGELLTAIAHNWRQPLTTVSLDVQEIREAYKNGELDDSYLERITDKVVGNIQKISNRIGEFGKLFRPDEEKKKIPVKTVLEAEVEAFKERRKEPEELLVLAYIDDIEINGYVHSLTRCLDILLENAADAVGDKDRGLGRIVAAAERWKEGTRITVTDNGGGVREEVVKRMFEPYYTTKFQSREKGMGLFILKVLVENHFDGSVSFENTGDGARFTLEFPGA